MSLDTLLEHSAKKTNQTIACPCCGKQFTVVVESENNKDETDILLQILDEMEAVGNNKIIKDDQEYYLQYMPDIENLRDELKQAIEIKSLKDRVNRLSDLGRQIGELSKILYLKLREKLSYGKSHFDPDITDPEYIKNAVDALCLLALITLAFQISCKCCMFISDEDSCRLELFNYKELILKKSGKDDKDILLWLNSKGVFIEYGELLYSLRNISQKINAYESMLFNKT